MAPVAEPAPDDAFEASTDEPLKAPASSVKDTASEEETKVQQESPAVGKGTEFDGGYEQEHTQQGFGDAKDASVNSNADGISGDSEGFGGVRAGAEGADSGFENVKEVDLSASERIAEAEVSSEARSEEIEGPEVSSNHFQKDGTEPETTVKEPDVVGVLFERVESAVASAQAKDEKGARQEDEVVDSVMEMASPWVHFAVAQAQGLKKSMVETTDHAVKAACDQLGELQDSSTMHYYYAKDMFWKFKREYRAYEDAFFSTLKDGVKAATNSPTLAATMATGAAFIFFRRPRRLLFKYTLGRFRSTEGMVTSAEKKVQDMRQSVDLQKNERKKLEERFRLAEDEFLRGQSKMNNAGGQIRSLVRSLYKTENKAQGLVENLRDLPGREALRLRAEVASMAAEAKQHRSALDKHLHKIANYNIPV